MDIIGMLGLAVAVAGFALALWQLARTRRAAEAALAASLETAQAIRFVNALTDIEAICGRSRDLLHLMRREDVTEAATAAFELRGLVAQFCATQSGRVLASAAVWVALRADVAAIHERLESAALSRILERDEREALLLGIARVHTQFRAFSARAVESGVFHGNPR